jgi:transcriptional regulator with XRE-family HTH domain
MEREEAKARALATLRRRVPWTQRELAAAAGVSLGTVRGIEQGGIHCPRPRVIRALAAALGVAPDAVAEFHPALGLPPRSACRLPAVLLDRAAGASG